MGHQWSHSATRVSGWPGAELRILVNGLWDLAYWGTWTQWPKKSETKISLTGTCRSEVDKSRHGPVKVFDDWAAKATRIPVGLLRKSYLTEISKMPWHSERKAFPSLWKVLLDNTGLKINLCFHRGLPLASLISSCCKVSPCSLAFCSGEDPRWF